MTEPVLGSGQLDDRQQELTARVQAVVTVHADTLMVKVLRPGSLQRYLAAEVSPGVWGQAPPFDYRVVGGVVARQQDCADLSTPADFIRAFRLDYPGTPFHPGMQSILVMEFLAVRSSQFVIPFGAPSPPRPTSIENQTAAEVAARRMIEAAEWAGLDPNTYRMEIRPWPFTGTGITADPERGVPERWRRYAPVPSGATIFEYDTSGRKRPVAMFRGAALGWEELR